jgi:hypothetical protein
MFTRKSIAVAFRCASVLGISYILPFQSYGQAGDASLLVLTNINKLFPPVIERFSPGGPDEESNESSVSTLPPMIFFRKAKKISAAYDGYAIELTTSERPLLHNDPIFKKFGNIIFDRQEDGKYAYLIPVPFSSKKSTESFLENVIKPNTPAAKLVVYKKGTCKN